MTHDDAEVAAVARGLTKAQAALLIEAPRTASSSYSPARRLVELRLTEWLPGAFGGAFRLTPLGLAVKRHLEAEAGPC